MTELTEGIVLLTREQLRLRLTEAGHPITRSYFGKICLPSRGLGPPVDLYFGGRHLYRWDQGLAWAQARAAVPYKNRAKVIYCSRCARAMRKKEARK